MPAKYFRSYKNYFWQWEEQASVVAIPNGRTIAYQNLIAAVIDQLQLDGLPPFGSVLLALSALHPQGKENVEDIRTAIGKVEGIEEKEIQKDALVFLNLLTQVPEKYKSGSLKAHLIKGLFRKSHNSQSLKRSEQLATIYKDKGSTVIPAVQFELKSNNFIRDFRVIALLNRQFSSVAQILSAISDIPVVTEEIELEEQTVLGPEELVAELIKDENTQKIGALVKVLWSGLNLPLRSSRPSQQPMGGVSDLTNKGDLAQLLISEYANDDLIFLSRLANNEALYLNRESPPTTDDMKRVILIDSSIKNWGTPKIISLATMLAIAKHPKTTIDCAVFVIGQHYTKINFNTVEGMINASQILSSRLDAAQGLRAYFDENPPENNREVFVITEKATRKEPEMISAANELGNAVNYWIYTNAEGHIDIYKKLKNSLKHTQHLNLQYKRLWEQNKKKYARKHVVKTTPSNKNPIEFYPILFGQPQDKYKFLSTHDGEVFIVTREKSLLRFENKFGKLHEHGWELLRNYVPMHGGIVEVGLMKNGDYVFLFFNHAKELLTLVNLSEEKRIERKFSRWTGSGHKGFVFHDDYFYHHGRAGIWRIDVNGVSEKVEPGAIDINDLIRTRFKALIEPSKKWYSSYPILKNVKYIGVTDTDNLVVQGHVLKLQGSDYIGFYSNTSIAGHLFARKMSRFLYEFPDGSQVRVDKTGMLTLISSDKSLPIIYVPLSIGTDLGIATPTVFAGNKFYFNVPKYELLLLDAGTQKLQAVKRVKEVTVIGLSAARDIVENTPSRLPGLYNKAELEKALNILQPGQNGLRVEQRLFNPAFDTTQEIIPVIDFYKNYLKKFVQVIKNK